MRRHLSFGGYWPTTVVALLLAYEVFHPLSNSVRKEWALCATIAGLILLFQDCRPGMVATRQGHCPMIFLWNLSVPSSHVVVLPKICHYCIARMRHMEFAVRVSLLRVLCYHLLEHPLITVGVGLNDRFSDRRNRRNSSCVAHRS